MLLMSILFIMNIQKINQSAHAYPDKLKQLNSPPSPLYAVGNLDLLRDDTRPWVAIVGTRYPTLYGDEVTKMFAAELAASGAIIVSGLALGVDALAHQAVVDQGLPVVAVQARGLDEIYPKENHALAKKILQNNGLIVSEYKPGVGAYRQNFIARNRIVSALSDGVLVTEANEQSGTTHTIRFALELGKTIMAVPGNINSKRSAGTNNMIRTGSIPVTSTVDAINALGYKSKLHLRTLKANSQEEQLLIDLLKEGVNQSGELIARSSLTAGQFANLISLMEIGGKVTSQGAGIWTLRY